MKMDEVGTELVIVLPFIIFNIIEHFHTVNDNNTIGSCIQGVKEESEN